jgi:hypothetical protein
VRQTSLSKAFLLSVSLGLGLGVVGACSDGAANSGDEGTAGGSTGEGGDSNANGASNGNGAMNGSGAGNGNGGDGAGNTTSNGGDGNTTENCGTSESNAELLPANLLFVLDRSGSMNCNPPEGNEEWAALCETNPVKQDSGLPSKWEVTRDALKDALDILAAQPNVSVGVSMFPKPESECFVEADPDVAIKKLSDAHLQDLKDFLDGVDPEGRTPIAGSTILSYQHLSEAIKAGDLEGNSFVVLLTDGAETCDDEILGQLVDTDVPNATGFNIRTFVIGAPGSEPGRSLLSDIAFEGLTPGSDDCSHGGEEPEVGDCHFDMTTSTDFAQDLSDALTEISQTKTLSCQYDIPPNEGFNRGKVNVTFTDGDDMTTLVDKIKGDGACGDEENGWKYSVNEDDQITGIALCGDICDQVRTEQNGELKIVLGCPTGKLN